MDDESNQAVNTPVDAGTTTTDSAPVTTTPEVAEAPSVQKDNGELIRPADTEPASEQATDEATTDETTETEAEQPQTTEQEELAPKSQNRFQQLANENREMRMELERLRQQEAHIANEQALLNEVNPETGDYYTPQEVERLAFAQSREQQAQQVAEQRYELEVQDVQLQLRDEATRALSDFPMFDETSKEYDAELASEVDEILGANLVIEQGTGRIIGSRVSPYKIYQSHVKAAERARTQGQLNGQRATEKMLASVDGAGSSQQGDVSFEKMNLAEQAAWLRRNGHDV